MNLEVSNHQHYPLILTMLSRCPRWLCASYLLVLMQEAPKAGSRWAWMGHAARMLGGNEAVTGTIMGPGTPSVSWARLEDWHRVGHGWAR